MTPSKMPRTPHAVSKVSLHNKLRYLLFWLVSIIFASQPCLLQRTESRESENSLLPLLVRNSSTAAPRGMSCSPEWEVEVRNYAEKHSFQSIDKLLTGFCSTSKQSVSQRWGDGGPGDTPKVRLENDLRLDSCACGKAMGETSHPMVSIPNPHPAILIDFCNAIMCPRRIQIILPDS